MTDVLLTPVQAAGRLGLSALALYRRALKGQIDIVRIGRLIRYRESDVAAVVKNGMQTPPRRPRIVEESSRAATSGETSRRVMAALRDGVFIPRKEEEPS